MSVTKDMDHTSSFCEKLDYKNAILNLSKDFKVDAKITASYPSKVFDRYMYCLLGHLRRSSNFRSKIDLASRIDSLKSDLNKYVSEELPYWEDKESEKLMDRPSRVAEIKPATISLISLITYIKLTCLHIMPTYAFREENLTEINSVKEDMFKVIKSLASCVSDMVLDEEDFLPLYDVLIDTVDKLFEMAHYPWFREWILNYWTNASRINESAATSAYVYQCKCITEYLEMYHKHMTNHCISMGLKDPVVYGASYGDLYLMARPSIGGTRLLTYMSSDISYSGAGFIDFHLEDFNRDLNNLKYHSNDKVLSD